MKKTFYFFKPLLIIALLFVATVGSCLPIVTLSPGNDFVNTYFELGPFTIDLNYADEVGISTLDDAKDHFIGSDDPDIYVLERLNTIKLNTVEYEKEIAKYVAENLKPEDITRIKEKLEDPKFLAKCAKIFLPEEAFETVEPSEKPSIDFKYEPYFMPENDVYRYFATAIFAIAFLLELIVFIFGFLLTFGRCSPSVLKEMGGSRWVGIAFVLQMFSISHYMMVTGGRAKIGSGFIITIVAMILMYLIRRVGVVLRLDEDARKAMKTKQTSTCISVLLVVAVLFAGIRVCSIIAKETAEHSEEFIRTLAFKNVDVPDAECFTTVNQINANLDRINAGVKKANNCIFLIELAIALFMALLGYCLARVLSRFGMLEKKDRLSPRKYPIKSCIIASFLVIGVTALIFTQTVETSAERKENTDNLLFVFGEYKEEDSSDYKEYNDLIEYKKVLEDKFESEKSSMSENEKAQATVVINNVDQKIEQFEKSEKSNLIILAVLAVLLFLSEAVSYENSEGYIDEEDQEYEDDGESKEKGKKPDEYDFEELNELDDVKPKKSKKADKKAKQKA